MFDYMILENTKNGSPVVHEQLVSQQTYSWDIPINALAQEHLKTMSSEELDNDWRLGEFFGTIAVINLPQDTERLKRITEELHAVGTYNFEVFPAIDGRKDLKPSIWKKLKKNRLKIPIDKNKKKEVLDRLHQGEAGCYMSHYLLIRRTKEAFDSAINELESAKSLKDEIAISKATNMVRKYSRILILEDDTGFGIVNADNTQSSKKDLGTLFRKALKTLPKHWDMLYLMSIAQEKTKKISKHIYQLRRSAFANAYAINYTMYAPLIFILEQIEDPNVKEVLPLDKAISYQHYLYQVYAIYPSIAFQFDGTSTIDGISTPTLQQHQPIHR